MAREHFRFWLAYLEIAEKIENTKDRCEFYDAIVRYGLRDEEPVFKNNINELLFTSIKHSIRKSTSCVDNGKQGGAPKGNKNASKSKKTTIKQP